jgi:hypothetical protein
MLWDGILKADGKFFFVQCNEDRGQAEQRGQNELCKKE